MSQHARIELCTVRLHSTHTIPMSHARPHTMHSIPMSQRPRKSKLFNLNRVLLFCRRASYNFANVNFYVHNSNVCIAVAILTV